MKDYGRTTYVIDPGALVDSLNVPNAKRWECPCECGAYVLYGWRKVGDDRLTLVKTIVRRHGELQDEVVDPEQNALWACASLTFYDDQTIRLCGMETSDEIGTAESIAFLPPLDRELWAIWLAIGLADALRKEMSV